MSTMSAWKRTLSVPKMSDRRRVLLHFLQRLTEGEFSCTSYNVWQESYLLQLLYCFRSCQNVFLHETSHALHLAILWQSGLLYVLQTSRQLFSRRAPSAPLSSSLSIPECPEHYTVHLKLAFWYGQTSFLKVCSSTFFLISIVPNAYSLMEMPHLVPAPLVSVVLTSLLYMAFQVGGNQDSRSLTYGVVLFLRSIFMFHRNLHLPHQRLTMKSMQKYVKVPNFAKNNTQIFRSVNHLQNYSKIWNTKLIASSLCPWSSGTLHGTAQHKLMSTHRCIVIRWCLRSTVYSKQQQTPWPLVCKRTISTERPSLVDEIECKLLWIEGYRVVSAADPLQSLISVF
jgi:hypothetical protein